MIIEKINIAKEYAQRVHDAAGCTYGDDNENYMVHLEAVANYIRENKKVFVDSYDYFNVVAAAYCHDVIEDAQQSYNDVKETISKPVADITLLVTDIPAENRLLRFINTVPKIVSDHRSLVLKVADIYANSNYGKGQKNGMYKKYREEWVLYKRGILTGAAKRFYLSDINKTHFDKMIWGVDELLAIN